MIQDKDTLHFHTYIQYLPSIHISTSYLSSCVPLITIFTERRKTHDK